MIPDYSTLMNLDVNNIGLQTSKDYNLNSSNIIDELEALKQVVYKILNTQRYIYPIYSWNYGVELDDLYGKPVIYVCAELENRIIEALTYDERISNVRDFTFDTSKKRVITVTFIVDTIFGELQSLKEVNY